MLTATALAIMSAGITVAMQAPASAEISLPPGITQTSDIVYETVDGVPLKLDAYTLDGGGTHPAIVYVHGGDFIEGTKQWMRPEAIYFAQQGFVGFSIDYRLSPESVYPAAVEDTKAAIEWVRQHASQFGADPKRIGLLGTSAGGTIVSTVGAEGRGSTGWKVAATASWSGLPVIYEAYAADPGRELPTFNRYILGTDQGSLNTFTPGEVAKIKAADPALKVTPQSTPFYLANSTNERVTLQEPQGFIDQFLKPNGVTWQFDTVPGKRHATQLFQFVRDPTSEFFDKYVTRWNGEVTTGPSAGPSTQPSTTPPVTQPAPNPRPRSRSDSNGALIAIVVIAGLAVIGTMLAGPVLRSRRNRWGY
jgi:acetyl esterase/lipase